MIRPIDIRLNAAHPELPLAEAVTFTGAPSTVLIRGVPPNCGRWAITAVFVAATFPDGSTTTRAAVQSANGVWVATLPATARSGRTENGLRVMADGIDENGAAVTGYILGVADFAVASLGVTPAPEPGETSWQMLYFDAVPGTLRKGDVAKVDGVLRLYNGTAWEAFAGDIPAPSTATPAMDGTGAAGTSAAFARGDHVHPTDTSRMAATATGADININNDSQAPSINTAFRLLNQNKQDALSAQQLANIAAVSDALAFDATHTYAAGDPVVYNGTLYTFTSAHTGAWTGNDVSAVDIIARLAGKLDKSGGTMTGGLTVPNLTVGSREANSAVGVNSVAEGNSNTASGDYSHAEGRYTTASGSPSHAEGYRTKATDYTSHAEGRYTTASGDTSHAEGSYTEAQNYTEHAQGRYNASHKSSFTFGDTGNTLSSIGFGTADSNRKNAVETMQDGKTYIYGLGNYDGTNPTATGVKDLATAVNTKLNPTSAAPEFSTSSTYAVGDHVTYNGALYRCTTAVTMAGAWDASNWTADMASNYFQYSLVTKTINNGAVSLDDRAINAVAVSSSLASLTVNFPTATSGKARDFAMRLNIAAGVTAPEIAWPQGVTLENDGGEMPEIADGGTSGSSTILYFSETENDGTTAKFLVKGETLTAITQA